MTDKLESRQLYVYAIMPCESKTFDSGNHHIYFTKPQKSRFEKVMKFDIFRADNNNLIGSFPAQLWPDKLKGDGSEMKLNYYSNTKSKWCDLTIQPCNKEKWMSLCPSPGVDYSGKWSNFIKAWFSGKSGIQSDKVPALPLTPDVDVGRRVDLALATADQNYKPTKEERAATQAVTAAEQKYGTGSHVDQGEVTTLLAQSLPSVPSNDPKGGKRKTKKSKKSRRKTKKSRRKTKKAKRKLKRSKRKH